MWYFDHDTTAMSDTKLAQLCIECGCGAVAAYWVILEQIYKEETGLVFFDNPLGFHPITKVVSRWLGVGSDELLEWVSTMKKLGLLIDDPNTPGAVISERAIANIEEYQKKAETARQNGKKGGRKPTQKPSRLANENQGGYDAETKPLTIKEKKRKENIYKETSPNGDVKKSSRFSPPTAAEVQTYGDEWMASKGKSVAFNAERFCAFYASKGWMVGSNKMKDWKQAVRGWIMRDEETKGSANVSEYDNDF